MLFHWFIILTQSCFYSLQWRSHPVYRIKYGNPAAREILYGLCKSDNYFTQLSIPAVLEFWKLLSIEIIELLKLLKNMQILNSNMVRVSVRVRWWECKSDGEDKSEVEHESAGFGEGVDRTEGGCKCVHISYSCGSEWCHVGKHEAIPLCLVCTYENRIDTLLFPYFLIVSIIQ